MTAPQHPDTPDFKSLDRIGGWTAGLLWAEAALCSLGLWAGILEYNLLARAMGDGITHEEASASDLRVALIGLLQMLAVLGIVVLFLMWIWRAHKNLGSLGNVNLAYTPGWAVWGFVIPFLNWVRPFQVMREVWHGSDPALLQRDAPVLSQIPGALGAPGLVKSWWGFFLASAVAGRLALRIVLRGVDSLTDLQTGCIAGLLTHALELPSACFAALIVTRVTRWQGARRQRLCELAEPETPKPPRSSFPPPLDLPAGL